MSNFYDYMGMARVVAGPDGRPIQLTGSGFEMAYVAKFAAAGVSIAMLLPTPALISTTYAEAQPCMTLSSRMRSDWSVTERIAFCRSRLSLNMTQLAAALRLERQTLYGWVSGAFSPHPENEKRLNIIVSLARDWERLSREPIGKGRTIQLSNGKTLCEMFSGEEIDVFEIRNTFNELKQVASLKSRGQERRELSDALGYNSASREDSSERLKMNLPV
jgi:DNA-binding transcriptional regulator YiaG